MKKISVAGIGYVGLSIAVLLAQKNKVTAIDLDQNKVDQVNKGISPLNDIEIIKYLKIVKKNIIATSDTKNAYSDADIVIIATPTDYDIANNYFNTKSIEKVIEVVIEKNPDALMVIKSTIPVGYVKKVRKKFNTKNIIFSPEFLREGKALFDNLHPTRIIVGEKSSRAKKFADLLVDSAIKKDINILFTNSQEAEAIKLFANSYLAMRVAYFNELDTYAEVKGLNSKQIIDGISLDPRIGSHYNNPSFGYGGYCLPKDTKQLLSNFKDVPQNVINSIVESNKTRINYIANKILSKNPNRVGIYRLVMKAGSDNFRESSIQSVMHILRKKNIELIIFEPDYKDKFFDDFRVEEDLNIFCEGVDLIIANRSDKKIQAYKHKLYTRDIFGKD